MEPRQSWERSGNPNNGRVFSGATSLLMEQDIKTHGWTSTHAYSTHVDEYLENMTKKEIVGAL